MSLEANKQTVRRLYAAIFNGDDPAALADLLDPS